MNYQKEKLRKHSHLQFHKKVNKIKPKNKVNQGDKRPVLEIYKMRLKKEIEED